MKSKLKKLAIGAALLSVSAVAFASTTDCGLCYVQACIEAICCL